MYDPVIASFISPDTIVQDWYDPQNLNRYCYVRNNPLKYTDPTGHITVGELIDKKAMSAASEGRSATLYALAFAKAAWSAFGAESVSKVADNIATNRNDATAGDVAGAVLDVATGGKGSAAKSVGKGLLSKAKKLLKAPPKSKTGSYTNIHASGNKYHGKGDTARSQKSGREKASEHGDPHVATDWTPAKNSREAFKDEAGRIGRDGGVDNPKNYNKINSPGEKYRKQDEQ